ncbi:hypothetical protein MVEN_01871200 [Mycena venus]|uniref:ADP-ribosylhydrolase ARH3 n=1 Tax=Mycena venus TaxID=2733690 RepID=A0A8H6XIY1_9AGAR|nr:hypothetical protein MVEN_01871200 [Mycena venus]
MASAPLHTQHLVPAPASTKIRLALLATALCDALGAPAEFKPRFSFSFISHMKPNRNFSLGAGVWTDDTSMMLALARSLGTYSGPSSQHAEGTRGGFDEADQLEAYLRWYQHGVLSAIGRCFDIGSTVRRALGIYKDALKASGALSPAETRRLSPAAREKEMEKRRTTAKGALARIARDLRGDGFGGNGSLMRVLPVGLAYARDPAAAAAYARRAGATTHPSAVCGAACAAWTECIAGLVRGAAADAREGEAQMSKLDVLHHFAAYPWPADADALRVALAADVPLPAGVVDPAAIEAHYTAHHRLMRLRAAAHAEARAAAPSAGDAARTLALLPSAAALPSSGYVVHTLAAALYAFLATRTFEAGALLAANMGGDADTVAAVYGGGWRGCGMQRRRRALMERRGLFWSPRVRAWRNALVRRDLIEEVAGELVEFVERHAASS